MANDNALVDDFLDATIDDSSADEEHMRVRREQDYDRMTHDMNMPQATTRGHPNADLGDFAVTMFDAGYGLQARANAAMMGSVAFGADRLASTLVPTIFDEGGSWENANYKGASLGAGSSWRDFYDAELGGFDQTVQAARDDLPFGQELAADILGEVLLPGTPGKSLDKYLDSKQVFDPTTHQSIMHWLKRAGGNMSLNTVDAYSRGDTTLGQAIMQGGLSTGLGLGIQAGIGNVVLPATKSVWHNFVSPTHKGYPAGAIAGESIINDVDDTLRGLYEASKNIPEGTDYLNAGLHGEGNYGRMEAARKAYNALARIIWPEYEMGNKRSVRHNADEATYNELLNGIRQIEIEAHKAHQNNMVNILGDPKADMDAVRARMPGKDATVAHMQDLESISIKPDGSEPLGRTNFSTQDAVDRIETRLLKAYNKDHITQLGAEETKVWNRFNDLLRGKEQELFGRDVKKIPIERMSRDQIIALADRHGIEISPDDLNKALAEKDYDALLDIVWPTKHLAELVSARKSLAATMQPGAMINGDTVQRIHVGATMKVLKEVDAIIDELSGGQGSANRAAWSRMMQVEDMYSLGESFYKQRHDVAPSNSAQFTEYYGMELNELLDTIAGDTELTDAFKAGFKNGMVTGTKRHSIDAEMVNFLGEPRPGKANLNAPRIRQGNYDALARVIGSDDAARVLDYHNNGEAYIKATEDLNALFDAKKDQIDFPAEFKGAVSLMVRKNAGATDNDNIVMATLAKLRAKAHPYDKHRLTAMMKLLTLEGKELEEFLQNSIRAIAPMDVELTGRGSAHSAQELTDYLTSVVTGETQKPPQEADPYEGLE